jgi:hypothetical protein
MARGSCGRDGPVVAGCFFPHLHRVALAAGAFALALAAKICGDRRLRVADHTAPALWHERSSSVLHIGCHRLGRSPALGPCESISQQAPPGVTP